jgi:hypothetical protein
LHRIGIFATVEEKMFFELRQYVLKPGQRENWVKLMEEEILPFQLSKGMVVVGSFLSEEEGGEDGLYVWIRRFDSEEQREALYAAVYETDHWNNNLSPRVAEMIDREQISVTRIVPTNKSVLR